MTENRTFDLASWRPGPTRAALEAFIAESVVAVAPEERVAVFDNDGTLWCEKPMYAQLDFAAGNTSGDDEMLEFSMSHDGPTMAMLIDHDDDEREYAYEGTAATFESSEPITDTATRLGWTTVSMRRDWDRIFPEQ